ncbi:putative MFS family arabinose efflux permease [Paenibacillus castaneae]|nr:putative MFS family arabinose efflux permease [Paenibacillus castaneae]
MVLLLYGLASMIGNLAGGKLLSNHTMKTVTSFPIALGIVYLLSFLTGKLTVSMIITIMIWGIFFAIGHMICQYWITSAIPEALDFANGLFLSCGNLGITIGTAVGGLFISGMGTPYIVLGGLLFLILSLLSILLKIYMFRPTRQHSS